MNQGNQVALSHLRTLTRQTPVLGRTVPQFCARRSLGTNSTGASPSSDQKGPLHGVRVIEVGNFIAGPHCGTILGYYGAEVIKIEPPGGDQIRVFRDVDETGTSWWWRSIGRNKKSIVLDMKKPGAQEIVRDLCENADVLLENFRPGKMEEWGLGPDVMAALNDKLIYTRVSGYGQTGPYAPRPGFASACEAMGGFRHVNGFTDRPSVRPNLSMGDTLAGINAALGTVMALFARKSHHAGNGFQVVDTSIVESVWGIMEGVLPDYDGAGLVREPSGSTVTGIVPTNTYPTKDNKAVVIGANSNTLFKRLMTAMERDDLAESDKYNDNQKRVEHQAFLDDLIGSWTKERTSEEVLAAIGEAQVPNGLIYSIEDIVKDPQYNARGMIEEVDIPQLGRTLKIPGMSPKFSKTPGKTQWAGCELGEHSEEVLSTLLGYSGRKILDLCDEGAVLWPENISKPTLH
mmetsp:Transcript_4453/g.7836  ORF Transcript_4453/g.7836 Transcript_4453/m.7836 type:complete len:460 (+) Transcript_4453:126-1505(+)